MTHPLCGEGDIGREVKRRNAGSMNRAPTNSPETVGVGFIRPEETCEKSIKVHVKLKRDENYETE
jgi:hypothetical protein